MIFYFSYFSKRSGFHNTRARVHGVRCRTCGVKSRTVEFAVARIVYEPFKRSTDQVERPNRFEIPIAAAASRFIVIIITTVVVVVVVVVQIAMIFPSRVYTNSVCTNDRVASEILNKSFREQSRSITSLFGRTYTTTRLFLFVSYGFLEFPVNVNTLF